MQIPVHGDVATFRAPVTGEQQIILAFPKQNPGTAFSRREIARKALRRRVYDEENPNWADVALSALVAKALVIIDQVSCYRLPPPSTNLREPGIGG